MIPPFTLKRFLTVRTLTVVGTMARPSSRSIFLPLLKQIASDGLCDAERIAGCLFFESRSRRQAAGRWLGMAEKLELVEKVQGHRYRLSPVGRQALERNEVFLPEYGTWEIDFSSDRLLPHPVLAVRRAKEISGFNEVFRQKKEKRSARRQNFRNLPAELLRLLQNGPMERVINPLLGSDSPWRMDGLAPKAEWGSESTELALEWAPVEGLLRVAGNAVRSNVDLPLPAPEVDPQEVWLAILAEIGLSGSWNCQSSRLRVFFEETTTKERMSLQRDLKVAENRLPRFGEFRALTVAGVPLEPRNRQESELWAEWRLFKSIRSAPTTARLDKWWRFATEDLGVLPRRSRSRLADVAKKRTEAGQAAVLLRAAEDWQLD